MTPDASGRRTLRALIPALLCLGLILPSAGLAAADTIARASDLLERMSRALRTLSYEGTLVYSHARGLETLHLVHQVDSDGVKERLLTLSGPVRAITREQDRVMCVLPDGHPLTVPRPGYDDLLNTHGIDPHQLIDHYAIELLGTERIAGRETDVLALVPRDGLRYGYRFYLDRETYLPLKSDLIDAARVPLEELMFTAIALNGSASVTPPPRPPGVRAAPVVSPPERWSFERLPAGFQLVQYGLLEDPQGHAVEHFLFTDRLSAYSVYVEIDTGDGLRGAAYIGAVNAAGRLIDGHQVTAVGEVPAATVTAAVGGIRLRGKTLP